MPSNGHEQARGRRIELRAAFDRPGSRHDRELRAFTHYCVARIERDLGEFERWVVTVKPVAGGFDSTVAVHDGGAATVVAVRGFDGPLAIWDAMCRLEDVLREARARRGA